MSGYHSRMLYDQCTFNQNTASSIKPLVYNTFPGMYENKAASEFCAANKGANVDNAFVHHPLRTAIDSDLKNLNRPNTRCAIQKYLPDHVTGKPAARLSVVTPHVCDRDIVPTNMRPQKSGF